MEGGCKGINGNGKKYNKNVKSTKKDKYGENYTQELQNTFTQS